MKRAAMVSFYFTEFGLYIFMFRLKLWYHQYLNIPWLGVLRHPLCKIDKLSFICIIYISMCWGVSCWAALPGDGSSSLVQTSAADDPMVSHSVFTITEKAPTRAFSLLKAPTSAFTFKTLLRHYANQPAHPLWLLSRRPNFTSTYRGVNAPLA